MEWEWLKQFFLLVSTVSRGHARRESRSLSGRQDGVSTAVSDSEASCKWQANKIEV